MGDDAYSSRTALSLLAPAPHSLGSTDDREA